MSAKTAFSSFENIPGADVPIAISVATGVDETRLMESMKRRLKANGRIGVEDVRPMLRELGVEFKDRSRMTKRPNAPGKIRKRLSENELKRKIENGTFLVTNRDHTFVIKDGETIDPTWEEASGSLRRITHVYEIA